MNVGGGSWSVDQKIVHVGFEIANRIAQILCGEVRYTISEETKNPEITLVAKVILPDHAAAQAVSIRGSDIDRIGSAEYVCECRVPLGTRNIARALDVVADPNERQFAETDIDILIPNVEGLFELVPSKILLVRIVDQIEAIVVRTDPGNVEIARAEVNIIGADTKTRRIQPEPVSRVGVVPIVEPLASPEGDLRSALDDVLHFDERFPHTHIEIRIGSAGIVGRQEGLVENAAGKKVWRHSERDVRHVGAIAKDVSLAKGCLHVEVVFVTETITAARVIRYFKVESAGTAAAVKHETGSDIHVEREIAGQRFQERFVQHWGWSLAWSLCTIRIAQDPSIQDRTTVGIRLKRLHLGFHGLDALLVLSLHLIHLRLKRIHVTLTGALSEKRVVVSSANPATNVTFKPLNRGGPTGESISRFFLG